jgi:hypothetical protein
MLQCCHRPGLFLKPYNAGLLGNLWVMDDFLLSALWFDSPKSVARSQKVPL